MKNYFLLIFITSLICCRCVEPSSYIAAVVELNPPDDIGKDFTSVANVTNQMAELIKSPELKNVDIVVLPELAFNRVPTAILLPNSTVFCDDPNAHFLFRDISCAARTGSKYVVIDVITKVYCSVDDQPNCANKVDSTNLYNMAIVFDRQGAMIAKYRKYHLFNENGVQSTETPDLTTFRTDFNVTFGVCICFDLMFDYPPNGLVERGVRHFVYPTMWFSEIPYLSAAQYQQSWAYANNVNLLAANINWPSAQCSGSGIYAGRLGALETFVSQYPATKVLIAKVPTTLPDISLENDIPKLEIVEKNNIPIEKLPKYESFESEMDEIPYECQLEDEEVLYDQKVAQDDMTVFSVKFLDFSKDTSHTGTVCNEEVCCRYDIDVSDNGYQPGKMTYSYAISVFNGHRHFRSIENLATGQDVCSLIACVEMNNRNSCGKRFSKDVHHRYSFERLTLKTELKSSRGMKVMPNTLAHSLLPFNATEFEYKISKLNGGKKYAASLSLTAPKSDLLTFAIFSRDYKRDLITSGVETKNNGIIFAICIVCSIVWMRWSPRSIEI